MDLISSHPFVLFDSKEKIVLRLLDIVWNGPRGARFSVSSHRTDLRQSAVFESLEPRVLLSASIRSLELNSFDGAELAACVEAGDEEAEDATSGDQLRPTGSSPVPVLTLDLLNDTGVADYVTEDPSITGQIASTLPVTYLLGRFGEVPGNEYIDLLADVQPDGSFILDTARLESLLGAPVEEGAHTFQAVVVDSIGGTSGWVSLSYLFREEDRGIVDEPMGPTQRHSLGGTMWHFGRNAERIQEFHTYVANQGYTADQLLPASQLAAPTHANRVLIDPELLPESERDGWIVYGNSLGSHGGDGGPTVDMPLHVPADGFYRLWVSYQGWTTGTGVTEIRVYDASNVEAGPVLKDEIYDFAVAHNGLWWKDMMVNLTAGDYIIKLGHVTRWWHHGDGPSGYSQRRIDSIYLTDQISEDAPDPTALNAIRNSGPANGIQWTTVHLLTAAEQATWSTWALRPVDWEQRWDYPELFDLSSQFWQQKIDEWALLEYDESNPPDYREPERQVIFDDTWNMVANPVRIARQAHALQQFSVSNYRNRAIALGVNPDQDVYMLWLSRFGAFSPLAQEKWPILEEVEGYTVERDLLMARDSVVSEALFLRSVSGEHVTLNIHAGPLTGSNGTFEDVVDWRVIGFAPYGTEKSTWTPFMLMNRPHITLPTYNVAGIWLTIDSKDVPAGDYTAEVTIWSAGVPTRTVNLNIRVSEIEIAPASPILNWGWTAPPEGEVYLQDYTDHGMNVWKKPMAKAEMEARGIDLIVLSQWSSYTPGIENRINKMAELGLDYSDYLFLIRDEPTGTNTTDLRPFLQVVEAIKSVDPNARIAFNPGEAATAKTFELLDPYADFWAPYVGHLGKADRREIFEAKPWVYYHTPDMWDRDPSIAEFIYGHLRESPAETGMIRGAFYFALNYPWRDAWDIGYEQIADQGVMILPTRHGPVSTRGWEASREGVQHANLAQMVKENPAAGAQQQNLIGFGSVTELILWLEENRPLGTILWDGDAPVGVPGDANSWGDANNWTSNNTVDVAPQWGLAENSVTFQTAPSVGTIQLEADRTVDSLTFQDDYTLSGYTLNVSSGMITVVAGVTATIDSNLVSAAGITKLGGGTLVIMHSAPDIVVNQGELVVSSTATVEDLTVSGPATAFVNGAVTGTQSGMGALIEAGDFSSNGVINAEDIDLLYDQVPGSVGAVHPRFDLVADGIVDQEDVDQLVRGILGCVYGDTNLDGRVDLTDYNSLVLFFDPSGHHPEFGWWHGNFDGNENVDLSDYTTLVSNFNVLGNSPIVNADNQGTGVSLAASEPEGRGTLPVDSRRTASDTPARLRRHARPLDAEAAHQVGESGQRLREHHRSAELAAVDALFRRTSGRRVVASRLDARLEASGMSSA